MLASLLKFKELNVKLAVSGRNGPSRSRTWERPSNDVSFLPLVVTPKIISLFFSRTLRMISP